MDDLPPFQTAMHAARFAYGYNVEAHIERAAMNKQSSPSTGRVAEDKIGELGAAQAGMLKKQIESIGPVASAYIIAKATPKRIPCTCGSECCSRSKPNPMYEAAISKVSDNIRDTLELERAPGKRGVADVPELRRAIVEKHFGKGKSIATMAKRTSVSEATVSNHTARIVRILKRNEAAAWGLVEAHLKELNVIQ